MIFVKQETHHLKKFINIHKDERCFIIGTGPSLNETQLDLLEGEITFGVNTIYKGNWGLKLNYYCIVDDIVWHNHKANILKTNVKTFYAGDYQYLKSSNLYYVRKLGFMNGNDLFWGNIEFGVYRGHTVITMCLQVAYYMGFKEVYLLGCDCNYKNQQHFDNSLVDNFLRLDWEPVFYNYKICRKIYEEDNRKIFNSTVGGNLEVFERVPLCLKKPRSFT